MAEQMGASSIDDLVQQMEQSEDDPRRCYALVRDRISSFKQQGANVPDDLVRLERALMAECMAQSQGR